ncbi:MAG: hypothetical protein M1837_005599 [Sclerophora amabilis]|nr:MAG: hypothetical protein M1837_005599 [Sclerophora amabilis]
MEQLERYDKLLKSSTKAREAKRKEEERRQRQDLEALEKGWSGNDTTTDSGSTQTASNSRTNSTLVEDGAEKERDGNKRVLKRSIGKGSGG